MLEIFDALKQYKTDFSCKDEFLNFYEAMNMMKNTEVFIILMERLNQNNMIKYFEVISNTRRHIAKFSIYNSHREVVRHTRKIKRNLK